MAKRIGKPRTPRASRTRLPVGAPGQPNGPHTTKGNCRCGGCSTGRKPTNENPLKGSKRG